MKIYYPNILFNENKTATTNIAWVADITEIELNKNKKLYIFLCIDIHSNLVIAQSVSQKQIPSQTIVRHLKRAIEKRFKIVPKTKTIIHTDRGTQFSSQTYNNFTKEFQKFIIPSMSRFVTPTDNPVAERFMRTFKEHLLNGKTVEQTIHEAILSNFTETKDYKKIINTYIKSLNKKPNKKSLFKGPQDYDKDVSSASMFMREPVHPKAFSERFGTDIRLEEIQKYKKENFKIVNLLEEFAAKKAEIVDRTPFDKFEGNLALELIDQRLNELYDLIQNNELIIRKSVEESIGPINENVDELREELLEEMESLNKKVDILLPKAKKARQTLPLRDPIKNNLFPIVLANAGSHCSRRRDLYRAQLRITYTILYHTGLRINEIRHLNQNDLERAIEAAQFNLIHHKTKQAHIHVLPRKAIQDLQNLKLEYLVVFERYQYKYLFGKNKPITDKNLIKLVNKDLKFTCEKFNIPFNIKSHSFRINMVTNLLKITSVQRTAEIIGHSDIRSTMSYNRYALSKSEIQDLLDQIHLEKDN